MLNFGIKISTYQRQVGNTNVQLPFIQYLYMIYQHEYLYGQIFNEFEIE